MSNYLIQLRLNELQTEISLLQEQLTNATIAKGITNPMINPLSGGGFFGILDVTSVATTPSGTVTAGTITGTTGNFTNLSATNFNPPTITTGNVITPGLAPPTNSNLNINVGANNQININGKIQNIGEFRSSVVITPQLQSTIIRQYSDNSYSVLESSLSDGNLECLGILCNTLGSNTAGEIVCSAPIVFDANQEFADINCTSVTAAGNIRTSNGYIQTNFIESTLGENGNISFEAPTTFNQPVTFDTSTTFTQTPVFGSVQVGSGGSILCEQPGGTYSIGGVGQYNGTSITCTGNITALTALGSNVLQLSGAYPVILKSTNALEPSGHPCLTLSTLQDNVVYNSKVYDEIFNPPPSVVSNTLAGILTNGNNANFQNITGVQRLYLNEIYSSSIGTITVVDPIISNTTIGAVSVLTNTIQTSNPGLIIQQNASGNPSRVYDVLYNPTGGNFSQYVRSTIPARWTLLNSGQLNATLFAIPFTGLSSAYYNAATVTFDNLKITLTGSTDNQPLGGMTVYFALGASDPFDGNLMHGDSGWSLPSLGSPPYAYTMTKPIFTTFTDNNTLTPFLYCSLQCTDFPEFNTGSTWVGNFTISFANMAVSLSSTPNKPTTIIPS